MGRVIDSCLVGLNNVGRVFWDYASGMFVQAGVLIVLLLIIDLLLRKRLRASLRCCLWMLVFIKLVLPPTLCLPMGIGYWYGDYVSSSSPVFARFTGHLRCCPAAAIPNYDRGQGGSKKGLALIENVSIICLF